jgi:hypothetical protein
MYKNGFKNRRKELYPNLENQCHIYETYMALTKNSHHTTITVDSDCCVTVIFC